MKNFNSIINLSLLDDITNTDFFESRPWEELFKNAVAKKAFEEAKEKEALKKSLLEAEAQKRQVQQKEQVTSLKVFRERPSFRNMLKEYNGRQTRSAPIKVGPAVGAPAVGTPSFESEPGLELISIPNIPGKILRPKQ